MAFIARPAMRKWTLKFPKQVTVYPYCVYNINLRANCDVKIFGGWNTCGCGNVPDWLGQVIQIKNCQEQGGYPWCVAYKDYSIVISSTTLSLIGMSQAHFHKYRV